MSKQTIKELVHEASMLVAGGKDSCRDCNENYCCVNQKNIEIEQSEFDDVKHLITPEQEARALVQFERTDGLFNCPFNDPETGECEIYDRRPYVCAAYRVFNPKEDCNSNTESELTILNPMAVVRVLRENIKYAPAFNHIIKMSENAVATNMLNSWKNYMKDKK